MQPTACGYASRHIVKHGVQWSHGVEYVLFLERSLEVLALSDH